MFELTGRKALVTGASGGIGEAIARVLHVFATTLAEHNENVARYRAMQKKQAEDAAKGAKTPGQTDAPADGDDSGDASGDAGADTGDAGGDAGAAQ